jgi:hypothetical protein
MNITRTPWSAAPSLPSCFPFPIPPTQKKKQCLLPEPDTVDSRTHSPQHPGTDTGEDHHHEITDEITDECAHKSLLPTPLYYTVLTYSLSLDRGRLFIING